MDNDKFVSFILIFILHFFFLSFALARNCSSVMNSYGNRRHLCLILGLKETVSNISLLNNVCCMLFVGTLFFFFSGKNSNLVENYKK